MTMLDQPLGQLARRIPGATRVFHEYQLDFCCGGKHSLRDAAASKGIDGAAIAGRLAELEAIDRNQASDRAELPVPALIDHIVKRFHARHRAELPELIRLAKKVEAVHGERADCPHGLAAHLVVMKDALEDHMVKEEEVLFPMLRQGPAAFAGDPIDVLRTEHDQHGESLQRLAELATDFVPPRDACTTWRALYAGLRAFRVDIMEHIHLENNVLFEKVLASGQPA